MNYPESMPPRGNRSPDVFISIVTASLTAAAITVAILFVTGNLQSNGKRSSDSTNSDNASGAAEATRQVPLLLGMTVEVAQELLRSRDLRLVVQGRRPDNNYKEGQIAEQDPFAESEIPAKGAVTVVVSTGPKHTEMPNLSGKTVQEAEQLLSNIGISVKEISETGKCTPSTVCESQPGAGSLVNEGSKVTLVIAASLTVPDVVGKYFGNAKEELEKVGLKVGKIRWRSNEDRSANIVLAQEPTAGTVASPGDAVDLFVNEE